MLPSDNHKIFMDSEEGAASRVASRQICMYFMKFYHPDTLQEPCIMFPYQEFPEGCFELRANLSISSLPLITLVTEASYHDRKLAFCHRISSPHIK